MEVRNEEVGKIIKKTYTISTNKLLYTVFSKRIRDEDIKVSKKFISSKQSIEEYYYEFNYESMNNNIFKVRISSCNKDYLKFTIHEWIVYNILITHARLSDDTDYYISLRKLRNIRGLDSNSSSTYLKYDDAITRLSNKKIEIVPIKVTYKEVPIRCNMLELSDINKNKNRIFEFNYSFGMLDTRLTKTNQKIVTSFNPFGFKFKDYFSIQISFHLLRMVALNCKKYKSKVLSIKKIFGQIYVTDSSGVLTDINYYEFLSNNNRNQSNILNTSYEKLEFILKQFVKNELIVRYALLRKTYKFIRDDEAMIELYFE